MDAERFDMVVRNLLPVRARRGLLAGFASGLLALLPLGLGGDEAAAKKKRRKRKRRKKRRCTADCTGKVCGSDGCGGTCGRCFDDGATCLSNGGCAIACSASDPCPNLCVCRANTEGEQHCVSPELIPCAELTPCARTTDCPAGQQCQSTDCPGGPRCISACFLG